MKIISIELSGYRRFALRNIQHLKIEFEQKVHQILGTNGSGKSSLLQELSPWPAVSQDFDRDGYKKIIVLHNQQRYTLLNQFSSPALHSVWQDGVGELNQSGTWAEQKDVVRQVFSLTQEIHQLMLGSIRFSTMGPNDRRQWLTRLSDISYTYAIGVYQKLKEQARDVQGALKIAQTRAIQEAEQCLSEEQEQALRAEVDVLRLAVETLLSRKPTLSSYASTLDQSIQQRLQQIQRSASDYRQLQKQFLNREGFSHRHAIDHSIVETQLMIKTHQQQLEKIAIQLESTQSALDTALANTVQNSEDIPATLGRMADRMEQLKQYCHVALVWNDPESARTALQLLHGPLLELVAQLPMLDPPYQREQHQAAQLQLKALDQQLEQLDSSLQTVHLQLQEQHHFKTHGETTCPECRFVWSIGYQPERVNALTTQQTQLLAQKETCSQERQQLESRLEQYALHVQCGQTYQSYLQRWPVLQPFWDHVKTEGYLRHRPHEFPNRLSAILQDLEYQCEYRQLEKEQGRLQQLLAYSQQQETGLIQRLTQEVDSLQTDYHAQTQDLQTAQQRLQRYTGYKATAERLARIQSELEQALDALQTSASERIQLLARDSLNQIVQSLRLELSTAEQTLSQLDVQRALAASLQDQVKELTHQSNALKILTQELSPTSGLIAQSLFGFIHHYVNQMNRFIAKGWLYPMQLGVVLPEEDDSIELDYKFQVQVQDGRPIPDISKTSSGMQEMIDLAFKVVAMQYLGLQEYPLLLDEFSARMDPAHRQSAYRVIYDLIEDSRFSQIFIVSHHYETYGGMKHADTTILCDANVEVSPGMTYNTCTSFQFRES